VSLIQYLNKDYTDCTESTIYETVLCDEVVVIVVLKVIQHYQFVDINPNFPCHLYGKWWV